MQAANVLQGSSAAQQVEGLQSCYSFARFLRGHILCGAAASPKQHPDTVYKSKSQCTDCVEVFRCAVARILTATTPHRRGSAAEHARVINDEDGVHNETRYDAM